MAIKGMLVLVLFMLLAVPTAHAQGTGCSFSPLSFDLVGCLSSGLLSIGQKLQEFQVSALHFLLAAIVVITSWDVSVNNVVIFDAWEIARDFANIFFILGLTLISFATIFRATGLKFFQNWHYQSALPRLLLAAILVNFSLGISEVVVLTSNRVTELFTNIANSAGMSISESIDIPALQTQTTAMVSTVGSGIVIDVDEDTLTFSEVTNVLQLQEAITVEEHRLLEGCPGRGQTPAECYAFLLEKRGNDFVPAPISVGQTFETTLLVSSITTNALFLLINISIGAAVAFFALRVIALWVLAWGSAFAFGFMWINKDILSKWWKLFLGWNVFGPLYLLVVIFGMTFLSREGELMASLALSGSTGFLPLLSVILFKLFAAGIFLGGLYLAVNGAFAQTVKGTYGLGSVAQKLGVFGATQGAKRLFGAAASRATTGARAGFQARKEKLVQQASRLRPQFTKGASYEQKLAAAREKRGVFGGAQEVANLSSTAVKDATSSLQNQLTSMPKEKQGAFLRKQMSRGSRDEKLAARQMLLGQNRLSTEEMIETHALQPNELAKSNFDKLVDQSAKKDPESAVGYKLAGLEGTDLDTPEEREKIIGEYYGNVLKNPRATAELDDRYFDSSTKEFKNMQQAINSNYPGSNPKRRKQLEQRMKNSAGSSGRADAVPELFHQEGKITSDQEKALRKRLKESKQNRKKIDRQREKSQRKKDKTRQERRREEAKKRNT